MVPGSKCGQNKQSICCIKFFNHFEKAKLRSSDRANFFKLVTIHEHFFCMISSKMYFVIEMKIIRCNFISYEETEMLYLYD